MEIVKNVLNWFEIPVSDFERARTFYSKIFDFDMPQMQMGANLMGFFLMDQNAGGIGGAICHGDGYVPAQHGTLVYLNGGSDLNVVLKRVEKSGGKVVLPKTLINPELGFFAIFIDSEGNKVALHSKK